jgi:hypothetical protein
MTMMVKGKTNLFFSYMFLIVTLVTRGVRGCSLLCLSYPFVSQFVILVNPVFWVVGRIIVHPGICPSCGVWGCDGILSIWRVLENLGNLRVTGVSGLGGDIFLDEL